MKIIAKGEFTKAFAESQGLSQAKAGELVNGLLDSIQCELKKGNAVNFTGFGKFEVVKRAARMGRNPGTGAAIKIPASKAPVFRAGATLKSAING